MKIFNSKKIIFILGIIVGGLITITSAAYSLGTPIFNSIDVGYSSELTEEDNVKGAIDDIYGKLVDAGIIYNCKNISSSQAGELVEYGGLNWKVINNDSDSVDLILAENLSINPFDTAGATSFPGSSSYYLLNTEFLLSNPQIKAASDHACLEVAGTYNGNDYYVRLPEVTELSANASNGSGTAFFTQTVSGSGLRFGNPDGTVGKVYTVSNQTWYRGYSKNPSDGSSSDPLKSYDIASKLASADAVSSKVTSVNYSYNKSTAGQYGSLASAPNGATFCYCTSSGTTNCNGWTSSGWQISTGCGTVYKYTLNSISLGLRPVIVVKK